jgi:phosphatidylinositol alpha-1,6-mannosyltransferase
VKSLLISSTYFPPQVGGISFFMANLVSALGAERVCCVTDIPAADRFKSHEFEPQVYRRPMAFSRNCALQVLGLSTTMAEIMLRERPRVVQLATVAEGYLGLLLKRWLMLPFVVYAHGNEILAAMTGEWEKPRLALRQADRVLANSRFTKEMVERIGVDANKIDVVHPGCETKLFQPVEVNPDFSRKRFGLRKSAHMILTVGNLVERKGHDMVIRALPEVQKVIPDVTYLVVGDGRYRSNLEQLAVAMGVRDCVVFARQIPDKDLPEIYSLCDVFAMPARERLDECDVEGFGLVYLEANACGKPVIGGRSGGIPDAIVDGLTGLLVDPHDSNEIANALIQLLQDRELSTKMGYEGRKRVVRDFTWERIARQVQGILDSVVRESVASRRWFAFQAPKPSEVPFEEK